MVLQFCKECNRILIPKKNFKEKQEINCSFCGEKNFFVKSVTKEIFSKETEKGKGYAKEINPFVTYENICKKCGFDLAQVIDIPAKYSDEDDVIFLKCGRCGFSEKIGRKIS